MHIGSGPYWHQSGVERYHEYIYVYTALSAGVHSMQTRRLLNLLFSDWCEIISLHFTELEFSLLREARRALRSKMYQAPISFFRKSALF